MEIGKGFARYDTGSAEDRTILGAELCSLMHFPHDKEKRGEFQDGLLGKAFEAVLPELSREDAAEIDLCLVFDLGKGAASFDKNLEESLCEIKLLATQGVPAMIPGEIVGTILLLALLAWAQGKRTGRTAIYKAIAGKSDRGGSIRTLQNVWRGYGSVAHFWAVFLLSRSIPNDEKGLIGFLSLAEFLRRWATSYIPDRAKDPIMDPATSRWISGDSLWAVALSLASLEPSSKVLEALKLSKPYGTVIFTSERCAFTCEH